MSSEHPPKDYYSLLGVHQTASVAAIRRAYRKKVMELHPDRNPDRDTTSAFQQLQTAYAWLRNEAFRYANSEGLQETTPRTHHPGSTTAPRSRYSPPPRPMAWQWTQAPCQPAATHETGESTFRRSNRQHLHLKAGEVWRKLLIPIAVLTPGSLILQQSIAAIVLLAGVGCAGYVIQFAIRSHARRTMNRRYSPRSTQPNFSGARIHSHGRY